MKTRENVASAELLKKLTMKASTVFAGRAGSLSIPNPMIWPARYRTDAFTYISSAVINQHLSRCSNPENTFSMAALHSSEPSAEPSFPK